MVDHLPVDVTSLTNIGMTGYCSALMKAIIISMNMDKEDIPNYVLEYVILEKVLEIRKGIGRLVKARRS